MASSSSSKMALMMRLLHHRPRPMAVQLPPRRPQPWPAEARLILSPKSGDNTASSSSSLTLAGFLAVVLDLSRQRRCFLHPDAAAAWATTTTVTCASLSRRGQQRLVRTGGSHLIPLVALPSLGAVPHLVLVPSFGLMFGTGTTTPSYLLLMPAKISHWRCF